MSSWLSPPAARERTLYPTVLCAETLGSEWKWNQFAQVVISHWTSAGSPKLVHGDICQLSFLCCWKTSAMLAHRHINRGKTFVKILSNPSNEYWLPFFFVYDFVLPHPGGQPSQWQLRAGEFSLQTRLGSTKDLGYNRSCIRNPIFCEGVSFLPPLYTK